VALVAKRWLQSSSWPVSLYLPFPWASPITRA